VTDERNLRIGAEAAEDVRKVIALDF